jgi:hypothetical protein
VGNLFSCLPQDDGLLDLGELDGLERKQEGKDSEEAKARRNQERIKQQLRKGACKVEGRVGYTPVYYDPPMKADGTLAHSCLKGRSGKRPLRSGLVFNDTKPKVFNYPPEKDSSSDHEA